MIDAVEQARKQVGLTQGTALFKGSSSISAEPTVIPRAIDIIRGGMSNAMKQATDMGYAASVVSKTFAKPSTRSGTAQADQAVSNSLQRLGFAD